ncbi:hypothetical protein EVAR_55403_1 [Eumeta japonica]|uniref:Uncharacterized protein n=1 Tax=Eumeta variegata TaxID=151549 RepID=A0A4C1YSW4_EUMVA|nr:hypothetical protein EVAR_55403_1 [Eumeta japonica]
MCNHAVTARGPTPPPPPLSRRRSRTRVRANRSDLGDRPAVPPEDTQRGRTRRGCGVSRYLFTNTKNLNLSKWYFFGYVKREVTTLFKTKSHSSVIYSVTFSRHAASRLSSM